MDYEVKSIRHNKGKPRIFLDGLHAARASFAPGDRYEVKVDEGRSVTIFVSEDGSRTVSGRVDRKTGEKTIPVIDLNSNIALGMFEGMDAVRMVVKKGAIVFLPLASELSKKERLDRLATKIRDRQPLSAASLTHGAGVLAEALHRGFKKSGLEVSLDYVNEIRADWIHHAREHNPAWHENTVSIAAPMQELIQDTWLMSRLRHVEILDMSLPCSGASQAGSSKLKLKQMEDHEHVGHLVHSALVLIGRFQPSVIVLENVTQYAATASASILRKQLRDMGYNTHEAVLEGQDFGCIEARVRWCLVATTEGLEFTFDQITPPVRVVQQISEILDDVPLHDPRWRSNDARKAKSERNKAEGKGFRLRILPQTATSSPVLRKEYQKGGTCDAELEHPENPALSRQFTGDEHLRMMGIDRALFGDVSESMKHQGAGQAVNPPKFVAVGERIGQTVLRAETYALYRRALLARRRIEEATLGEGIAYDPVPSAASVVRAVQRDLFGDPMPAQVIELPNSTSVADTATRKKRLKLGGGGIG
jgi:DNA (cytosine-5)-methyltransferase 1